MNTVRRTRGASISVDVDVHLDEFDIDDIVEYLRDNGYQVSKDAAPPEGDLEHIYTLAVAGQMDAAREEALKLVSNAIGRPLQ